MKQILCAVRGQTATAVTAMILTAGMPAQMKVIESPSLHNAIRPDTAPMSEAEVRLDSADFPAENDEMNDEVQTWDFLGGENVPQTPGPDDWMQTIGAFEHNSRMRVISEEGRRIRKTERDY